MLKRIIVSILVLFAATTTAPAQVDLAGHVQTHQAWSVFVADTAAGRICFMTSQPENTDPTGVNRDAIYFMLANWPLRGATNEASIIIGYPFEVGSTVSVVIDNDETFEFFTIDDAAWLSDLGQETDLVVAMQRGITMVVRGRSQRGTDTTDTYSLRGVTDAINRAAQECS